MKFGSTDKDRPLLKITKKRQQKIGDFVIVRVSVQGFKSLWGDCMFIPADWGS